MILELKNLSEVTPQKYPKRSRTLFRSPSSNSGFTLVEMLVSVAVLLLIVVLVTQLTNGAATTIANSGKHMDADSQARLIFDRMANDFDKMLRRKDVDCMFYKNSNTGPSATGGNDALFFYSEAPAYVGANPAPATTALSDVALVGYRVYQSTNPNTLQLDRLGEVLTWDGKTSNDAAAGNPPTSNTAPGGMVCFIPGSANAAVPDPASTIAGNWIKTIGTLAGNYVDGVDGNYHALGDQAFRLEIAFLLNDGSISSKPVMNPASSKNLLTANSAPTITSDTSSGYVAGSRWYDTTASVGYICTNASTGVATWNRIGIQDVSAIIVAIAILDTNSRKTLPNATYATASPLVSAFPDAEYCLNQTPPQLMAQTWTGLVNSGSFAQNSAIPQAAASQVRVYQRYFYLNNK